MPSLAKRPCSVCGVLGSGGRCTEHTRQLDRSRGKTAERGYDAAHKQLRVLCFGRDEWRCVDCGWEPQVVTDYREAGLGLPAAEVVLRDLRAAYARKERHLHADHQIPIEQAEGLRLDLDNLKTRCNECHSKKTATEDGGFGHHRAWMVSKDKETAHFPDGNQG